jgi:uncharacterized membrane protein YkvI
MKHYRKIGNRYVQLDSYRKSMCLKMLRKVLSSKMLGKVLDATTFVLMTFIIATVVMAAAGIDITQLQSHPQEIHHD